jgi:hypothetical protein
MLWQRGKTRTRRGIVVVLVALGLIGIVGAVALTVDGGLLQLDYRKARAHADAAAMAAACIFYQEYPTNGGKDASSNAYNEAVNTAARNGCANDGKTSKLVVNIPPLTGPYKGLSGYVEVYVTYYVTRGFSRIFASDTIPVQARAVARGAWIAPKAGIIVLDYDDRAALNAQGNGAFTETGAPVIVNSDNASATVTAGNGAIRASEFYVTGGVSLSGNSDIITSPVADQIFTGTHPTPDPLKYLPEPAQPDAGTMTQIPNPLGGGTIYTLTPGTYTNLPNFGQNDKVIFQQASTNGNGGIFYINGGGLHSTGATLVMGTGTGGIMIYNNPASTSTSEKIQITGNPDGIVTLSGLTSGPYAGIVLWQERSSTVPILVEGNGNFNLQGTFYAAGAMLNVNGNGKTTSGVSSGWYVDDSGALVSGQSRIGSQYIVNDLSLGGNGNISLAYNQNLVARTRVITLVE